MYILREGGDLVLFRVRIGGRGILRRNVWFVIFRNENVCDAPAGIYLHGILRYRYVGSRFLLWYYFCLPHSKVVNPKNLLRWVNVAV